MARVIASNLRPCDGTPARLSAPPGGAPPTVPSEGAGPGAGDRPTPAQRAALLERFGCVPAEDGAALPDRPQPLAADPALSARR
jgi:hypothetical protein